MWRGPQEYIPYELVPTSLSAYHMFGSSNFDSFREKVRSPDGDTNCLDIVASVLQGYTLAPYHFISCLDYGLRKYFDKMKNKRLPAQKGKKQKAPAQTITDADYADGIAFWQIHPPKLKPCYIIWNEQLQA